MKKLFVIFGLMVATPVLGSQKISTELHVNIKILLGCPFLSTRVKVSKGILSGRGWSVKLYSCEQEYNELLINQHPDFAIAASKRKIIIFCEEQHLAKEITEGLLRTFDSQVEALRKEINDFLKIGN